MSFENLPPKPPRRLYINDTVLILPEYRQQQGYKTHVAHISEVRILNGALHHDLIGTHLDENILAVPDEQVELLKRSPEHWNQMRPIDNLVDEANYKWFLEEGELFSLKPDDTDEGAYEFDLTTAKELLRSNKIAGIYISGVGVVEYKVAQLLFDNELEQVQNLLGLTFPEDPAFEDRLRTYMLETWV